MENLKPCPFCGSDRMLVVKRLANGEMDYACVDCALKKVDEAKNQILKPCPFCGSEAQLEYCGTSRCFRMHTAKVECSACGVIGDSGASYKSGEDAECDAINKWNTRASGWISVDDALPENDAQYIAWVGERAIVLFYCDDGYWCEHYGTRDYSKYVTHWMPLPQMPEVKHG